MIGFPLKQQVELAATKGPWLGLQLSPSASQLPQEQQLSERQATKMLCLEC